MKLNFTSSDGYFVSDVLTLGSSQALAYHLKFSTKGAKVFVEALVDESLGWRVPETAGAIKVARDLNFLDTLVGPTGLKVRIKTDYMPADAYVKFSN